MQSEGREGRRRFPDDDVGEPREGGVATSGWKAIVLSIAAIAVQESPMSSFYFIIR